MPSFAKLAHLTAATCIAALVFVVTTPSVDASPRGYDIDRFLRNDMPDWRTGRASQPAPQARPLDRIPNVPAPALVPDPAAAPAAAPPRAIDDGGRVIRKPGSPRSTVSGAWSPRN